MLVSIFFASPDHTTLPELCPKKPVSPTLLLFHFSTKRTGTTPKPYGVNEWNEGIGLSSKAKKVEWDSTLSKDDQVVVAIESNLLAIIEIDLWGVVAQRLKASLWWEGLGFNSLNWQH